MSFSQKKYTGKRKLNHDTTNLNKNIPSYKLIALGKFDSEDDIRKYLNSEKEKAKEEKETWGEAIPIKLTSGMFTTIHFDETIKVLGDFIKETRVVEADLSHLSFRQHASIMDLAGALTQSSSLEKVTLTNTELHTYPEFFSMLKKKHTDSKRNNFELDISQNFFCALEPDHSFALELGSIPSLQTLSISGARFKDTQIKNLLNALEKNSALLHLNLSRVYVSPAQQKESYRWSHCLEYHVEESIVSLMKNTSSLQSLDLSFLNIHTNSALTLCRNLLKNQTIEELNVSYNYLGSDGVVIFLRNYTNKPDTTLRKLDLSFNGPRPEKRNQQIYNAQHMVDACAALLKSKSPLTSLYLQGTTYSDSCDYSQVFKALETNTHTQQLNVSCSLKMLDKDASYAAIMLSKNKTLTELHLEQSMSAHGITLVLNGLRENKTLRTLTLCSANFNVNHSKLLLDILQTNHTFCDLNFFLKHPLPPGLEAALKRNKLEQQHYVHQWQRLSILTSFMRANADSALKNSVLPLIDKEIMKLV